MINRCPKCNGVLYSDPKYGCTPLTCSGSPSSTVQTTSGFLKLTGITCQDGSVRIEMSQDELLKNIAWNPAPNNLCVFVTPDGKLVDPIPKRLQIGLLMADNDELLRKIIGAPNADEDLRISLLLQIQEGLLRNLAEREQARREADH